MTLMTLGLHLRSTSRIISPNPGRLATGGCPDQGAKLRDPL